MVLKKDGCEDVWLSWEKVASRIATLMARGRYAEAPKPEQPVAEETVQVQSTEAMEPISAPEQSTKAMEPISAPEQPVTDHFFNVSSPLGVALFLSHA